MKKSALTSAFLLAVLAVAPLRGKQNSRAEYKARDGSRAVILTAKKAVEGAGHESVVEFYSAQNQRLCSMDFSSSDGEHGFAVEKAAWTPDQNFFVFSLGSSGGHQPWHSPTFFFSLRGQAIRDLETFAAGAAISKADFGLAGPNTVLTEVWREEKPVPAKFRLDSLKDAKLQSKRTLHCAGGRNLQVDSYERQIP